MSQYKIVFEKAALKFIRKQNVDIQTRLLRAIYALPYGADIKKLRGFQHLYRLRVGDIRVIYSIDEEIKIIDIQNIGYRGDVYN